MARLMVYFLAGYLPRGAIASSQVLGEDRHLHGFERLFDAFCTYAFERMDSAPFKRLFSPPKENGSTEKKMGALLL